MLRTSLRATAMPLAAAAVLFLTSTPAQAQGLALFASGGTSDHTELRRPIGYGVYASVPLLPFLSVRVGYDDQTSTYSALRTVCDSYWPSFTGCAEETMRRSTKLGTMSAAGMVGAEVASGVRLEVGGGPTRTNLRTSTTTTSGRGVGDVMPGRAQNGFAWIAGATVDRPFGGRFSTVTEVVRRRYSFDGCFTDVGAPFCGDATVTELRLGIRR